jgi:uncharacterized membrane protein YeaQ/YmgE (transglycosylase-associated protein family)
MVLALAAVLAFLLVFFLVVKAVAFLIGLVYLLLVALVCGWLAEELVGYKKGGIGTTVGVGLLGALIGWLIAKLFHLPMLIHLAGLPVIWTIVGGAVLAFAMKIMAPTRKRLTSGQRDIL